MTKPSVPAVRPAVSVIVPARNEAAHIRACLDALIAQSGAPSYEIIVVDNGSSDPTPDIIRLYSAAHPHAGIRLVIEPTPGRGAARAAGFAAATGALLLSTDADSTVPAHWVATLAAALADPRIVAVTGRCRITDCAPATNAVFNWLQPTSLKCNRLVRGHWWLIGSNFGIKRTVYEHSGGFNRLYNDQEDIELSSRIALLGRIKALPAHVAVTTNGDRFKDGLLRGLWLYMKSYIGRFWLGLGDNYAQRD
jgi:glycosyltransferase involved in cell wall biosynthesis